MESIHRVFAFAPVRLASVGDPAATSRPDLIRFMADDPGCSDLGSDGSKIVRPPHLARTAREGFSFTQFHAAPSSARRRAACS
jgi:arylsulfatase A-like enzyme